MRSDGWGRVVGLDGVMVIGVLDCVWIVLCYVLSCVVLALCCLVVCDVLCDCIITTPARVFPCGRLRVAASYSPIIIVPSAQPGLTSLFGMGRGGAPAL